MHDRGGAYHAGPRAHVVERTAEVGGIVGSGLHQREKRDPRGEALFEAPPQLRRGKLVGEGVLRGHRRTGHGEDPALHIGTGGGRSPSGSDGISGHSNPKTIKSKVTVKQ